MLRISLAILAIGAVFVASMFREDEDRPDPEFLATELYFQIGQHVLAFPAVAVPRIYPTGSSSEELAEYRTDPRFFGKRREHPTRAYKSAVSRLAGDPEKPATLGGLSVSITRYETHGEHTISTRICSLLTRDWSKRACEGKLLVADIPRSFALSNYGGTRGQSSDGSLVAVEITDEASTGSAGATERRFLLDCMDRKKRCHAHIEVMEGLYAAWDVSCKEVQINDCAKRESPKGVALSNFVRSNIAIEK